MKDWWRTVRLVRYICLCLLLHGVTAEERVPNKQCVLDGSIQTEKTMEGCTRATHNHFRFQTKLKEVQHIFKLKRVDGCIFIVETPLINLDFLALTEFRYDACGSKNSGIYNNPDLCLTPRIDGILREKYGAKPYGNAPADCHKTCVAETFKFNITRNKHEQVICYTLKGHFTMTEKDDEANWWTNLSTVENVNGSVNFVNMELTSLDIPKYFPTLTEISPLQKDAPLLVIRNNLNLKDIVLPSFLKGKRVLVRGNRILDQKTIDTLKKLTSPESQIQQTGECDFPIDLTDEKRLSHCNHVGSDLIIEDSEIIAVANEIQTVAGSIVIVNNKFTSLDISNFFPKLVEVKPIHEDDPVLIVRFNQKLNNIVLPSFLIGKRIIVRGNPVLDQKTIDNLEKSTSSDSEIQQAGECGFLVNITKDYQLGACTRIGSDLVLKDSAIFFVTNKIQDVAGCIVIENTNLDNLEFLELNSVETPKCVGVAESRIENNAKLCVTPRIERILKEVYNAKIQANGDCDRPCDQTRDMIRIQKEEMQCKKFSTGLKITENSPPIDVSRLESVDGSIIVEETSLESIKFPQLMQINPKNNEPALIIENNLKLVDIELPASLPSFKVRVRGNKLLSQNSIDRLRKWSPDSDIQQKGECGFVKAIQKASDLDGCERISSDLITKSRNIDEITQNIIAVDGCISIVGTPLKSIDFLKLTDVSKAASTCKNGGQSEVRQNTQLCLRPRVRKVLEKSFGAEMKSNKHEDCASTCNGSSLAKDYQKLKEEGVKCTILQGNLVISGLSKVPDWFNALKTVTEIQNGALIIENNTISEITVFPKLMTVENEQTSDQAVAIQIRNNENLVKLEFPVLEEVSIVSGDVRVLIENNPKFQMSLKMKERFDNLGEGVSYDKAGEPKKEEPKKDKKMQKSAHTCTLSIVWICFVFVLAQ